MLTPPGRFWQLAARKVAEARLEAAAMAATALDAAECSSSSSGMLPADTISSDFTFYKFDPAASGFAARPAATTSRPTFGAPPPT